MRKCGGSPKLLLSPKAGMNQKHWLCVAQEEPVLVKREHLSLKNETVLIENDNMGGDAMKLAISMVLTTLYLAAFVTVCDTPLSFALSE
jgi:hypothetical protein